MNDLQRRIKSMDLMPEVKTKAMQIAGWLPYYMDIELDGTRGMLRMRWTGYESTWQGEEYETFLSIYVFVDGCMIFGSGDEWKAIGVSKRRIKALVEEYL